MLFMLLAAALQTPSTDPQGLAYPGGDAAVYKKWKIGFTSGYKERKLSHNRWKVGAQAGGRAIKDLGLLSTLYRSAVIAKAAGYSRFYTVKLDIQHMVPSYIISSNTVTSQHVYSTIVLHNDPAAPPTCEAKPKWVENCRDHSADEVIAVVGPMLGQDSSALETEVRETRARHYPAL